MAMDQATGFPLVVVSVDVGGTKIAGALVRYGERGGTPVVGMRRQVPTDAQAGGAAVLEKIVSLVADLIDGARSAHPGEAVAGIGVSTAGSVDEERGSIAFANDIMPGWMGQPVAARLEEAFGVPVAVQNDVHAYALGELRHGAAKGASTAIVVAAGTGLGGAVVAGGRVLGGAHGFAGMLGHTLHHAAEGFRCACGVEGHLECVASGSGIEAVYRRELARAGGDPAADEVWDCTPPPEGNPVSGAVISRLALEGDPVARRVIENAGRSLGEAIASWAGVVDPELAVVSGSVAKAGALWRDALEAGLSDRLAPEFRGRLPVVDAALGDDAPLVGAAERLLDKIGPR